MDDQKHQLREAAIEAIWDIAQHLPLDCQMFLVVCRPGKDDFDLVLPSPEANLNNALDALRRQVEAQLELRRRLVELRAAHENVQKLTAMMPLCSMRNYRVEITVKTGGPVRRSIHVQGPCSIQE